MPSSCRSRYAGVAGTDLAARAGLRAGSGAPADASAQATRPWLAYLSAQTGYAVLYALDAEGSPPRQLTPSDWDASGAIWSPEGSRLALTVKEGVGEATAFSIVTMSANGGDSHPVASEVAQWQMMPALAPDGSSIAFMAVVPDNADIMVAALQGAAMPRLVAGGPHWEMQPVWSPDGQQIAFASNRSGAFEIYSVSRDGGNWRQLTALGGRSEQPVWSPDGGRIAFLSGNGLGHAIYLINADGSDPHVLAGGFAQECLEPAWSPDGKQIAFSANADGVFAVYVADANYGPIRRLVVQPGAWQMQPAWSPDGREVAFTANPGGNWDIYVAAVDGGHARRLTDDPARDVAPRWAPAAADDGA